MVKQSTQPQKPTLLGNVDKKLELPLNATATDRRNAVDKWCKQHLRDKYLIASDNRKIRFNAKVSIWHLSRDGSYLDLEAKAIPYIVDVFKTGQYVGSEPNTKDKNSFIRFHTYQKWVKIDGKNVHLQAKAGEYENGKIEVLPQFLLAYTQQILNKEQLGLKKAKMAQTGSLYDAALQKHSSNHFLAHSTHLILPDESRFQNLALLCDGMNDTLLLDDTQQPLSALTILAIEHKSNADDEMRKKINLLFARYGWN